MLILRIIALLILTLAPLTASGQDMLSFADSLAHEEDHYRAITEYKRFLHHHPEDPRAAYAQLQIGRCLIAGERWIGADKALEKVWQRFPHSPEARDAKKLYADAAFTRGDHEGAAQRYAEIAALHPDNQTLYRQGLTELQRENPDQAKTYFSQLDEPDLQGAVDQYLQLPRKSPRLAGTLSAIMPGAGQLYTERPKQAGIAFALNAAFIYGAVEAWENENYAISALLSLFEIGWYGGNIYNAMNNAHKFNQRQTSNFLDRLQERVDLSLGWSQGTPVLTTEFRF